MKKIIIFLFILCISIYSPVDTFALPEDAVLRERIERMDVCAKLKFNKVIKSYIKTYTESNRDKAELILGRVVMYFPVFEKMLQKKGMPESLKYLSITESALNPMAVSRSNAVGLWQFMAPTAKDYGLRMNFLVDERKDPIRSTEAAFTYLAKLHSKYKNWSLALAAYNGGPGRVNRAIKRSRSRSFKKVKKYLPKETQNYVSAFLGAAYLVHYYKDHGLEPLYPELDLQMLSSVKIHKQVDLSEVSKITQIPLWKIQFINPSYNSIIVPQRFDGNYVFIPKRVLKTFLAYLDKPDSVMGGFVSFDKIPTPTGTREMENFIEKRHIVRTGENLFSISKLYEVSTYTLKAWNKINLDYVYSGQELKIFTPKHYSPHRFLNSDIYVPVKKIPNIKILPILYSKKVKSQRIKTFSIHVLKRRESLLDLVKQYNLKNIKDLLKYNKGLNTKSQPRKGTSIKIPTN